MACLLPTTASTPECPKAVLLHALCLKGQQQVRDDVHFLHQISPTLPTPSPFFLISCFPRVYCWVRYVRPGPWDSGPRLCNAPAAHHHLRDILLGAMLNANPFIHTWAGLFLSITTWSQVAFPSGHPKSSLWRTLHSAVPRVLSQCLWDAQRAMQWVQRPPLPRHR